MKHTDIRMPSSISALAVCQRMAGRFVAATATALEVYACTGKRQNKKIGICR